MKVTEFTKIVEAENSPGTARQYTWHTNLFLEWFENLPLEKRRIEIHRILQAYIDYQTVENESPWSRSTMNVAIYAITKYYAKAHRLAVNKKFVSNLGEKTGHQPRVLNQREVDHVFKMSGHLPEIEQVMIHLGWEACLRTSELVSITQENLLAENVLRVKVAKAKNAWKRVPLKLETYQRALALVEEPGKPIFRDLTGIEAYTPTTWSKYFREWTDTILTGGVRWHDFARHSRLTILAESGVDFLALLQLSGHQSPAVCRKYFETALITTDLAKVLGTGGW